MLAQCRAVLPYYHQHQPRDIDTHIEHNNIPHHNPRVACGWCECILDVCVRERKGVRGWESGWGEKTKQKRKKCEREKEREREGEVCVCVC